MSSRQQVAQLWDAVIDDFRTAGVTEPPPELRAWFDSCRGTGATAVRTDCFPEPYIGDLLGEVSAVVLGLNPGRPYPALQSQYGAYAAQIAQAGGYTAWAASWPYLGRAWTDPIGRPNAFHVARRRWVDRWTMRPASAPPSHLVVELYPWHSTNLPAQFRPDPAAVAEYIWAPLSEFGPVPMFAFGSGRLFDIVPALPGVEVLAHFPEPGRTAAQYGFSAASREVMIGRTPSGGLLYVANHHGSDRLPPLDELPLHQALASKVLS
jgi:hypothetical protein